MKTTPYLALAGLLLGACTIQSQPNAPLPLTPGYSQEGLSQSDEGPLSEVLHALWKGTPPEKWPPMPVRMADECIQVSVVARKAGRVVWRGVGQGDRIVECLDRTFRRAKESLAKQGVTPDGLQVDLHHGFRKGVSPVAFEGKSMANRGLVGYRVKAKGRWNVITPGEMIAENRPLSAYLKGLGLATEDTGSLEIESFLANQIWFSLKGKKPRAHVLYRGQRIVPVTDVTRQNVEAFADRAGAFLKEQIHADGRLTYQYWPSRNHESAGNNVIRQFASTAALEVYMHQRTRPQWWPAVRKNLRYNLQEFYQPQPDGAAIVYHKKAKLGALALGAYALWLFPGGAFSKERAKLDRQIDLLWQPSGEFSTWVFPKIRPPMHNFYPGEALFYWNKREAVQATPERAKKIRASFKFYRDYWRKNRNTAFISWHTQAYAGQWQRSHESDYLDFVFEMNDWLVQFQTNQPYPDQDGRFYAPKRKDSGLPHASSLGTYLEALVPAYELAKAVSDVERKERYRKAIVRGMRLMLQLQFRSPEGMYYVVNRQRTFGGLRTRVYENSIRCDNVQHTLMAALAMLKAFDRGDYHP